MASKRHIEPITSSNAFAIEQANNKRKFLEMMKAVRPDMWVLMDVLDQTKINFFVIVKIVRALNAISKNGGGDGWGEVKVEIQADRVLFVRGVSADRLNEALTIDINTDL